MTTPARFYDGVRSVALPAEATCDGQVLTFVADGQTHGWPLAGLSQDRMGDQVRLSQPGSDARLVLAAADWALLAPNARAVRAHSAGGGKVLIGWLVGAAVATILIVFVGFPMAAGPLARATPLDYETRMGANYNAQIGAIFPTCEGRDGQAVLEGLGQRIAAEADSPFPVQVRAVHAPMINAFALPGGHVLVTDDLIEEAESPDELAAVIAHEIAHVERRHVMQAVWRDLGAGMILDLVVGGGTGAGQQAVLLAGQTSQLSYGRAAEAEADAQGAAFLHRAGLSSQGMAAFFARMAEHEGEAIEGAEGVSEFLASHPNTRRRIEAARAVERPGASALSAADWETVRATCASGRSENGREPWFDRFPGGGSRPGTDRDPTELGQPDKVREQGQAGRRP